MPRQTGRVNTDDAVAITEPFIDQAARDRVTVSGADAQTYLQSQIAQEIRDLAVGAARWTFVLDPTGKVEVLARIQRTGDDVFVLDTDAGFGDTLLARINRFKIRVDAETRLDTAANASPDLAHELGRIAAGWPKMGAEIEPGSTIPATTGVTTLAVNFQKGCYPGQELVERMDSRGAEREIELHLTGNMERYIWSLDGLEFGQSTPVHFGHGERVRVILHNDTMMTHPMHLHGLWSELETPDGEFQVRKHVINVQPAQRLSFLVTADALGRWAWHCHLLLHMESGMFREVVVA